MNSWFSTRSSVQPHPNCIETSLLHTINVHYHVHKSLSVQLALSHTNDLIIAAYDPPLIPPHFITALHILLSRIYGPRTVTHHLSLLMLLFVQLARTNEGSRRARNVDIDSPKDTASHNRRPEYLTLYVRCLVSFLWHEKCP
jgi:hypothetical protein